MLVKEEGNWTEATSFLDKFVDIDKKDNLFVSATNVYKLINHPETPGTIVNFGLVNRIRHINRFFIAANEKLEDGGLFLGCFETFTARQFRKYGNKKGISYVTRSACDFVCHRLIPKLYGVKKLYFAYTKGQNRLLSKAEVLGRLVYCGFEVVECVEINNINYFVVRKVSAPRQGENPSYGPLFAMPRVGKHGKIFKVYKFRTMHPYSEYLQDYVLKISGYAETGKPANDFRLAPWGKILRKCWIDELPQLLNILTGDMKLVGVRPVSARYMKDVPKELQILRLSQKPGCIPPYVALNMGADKDSVLEAERIYLNDKIANPYFTDTRYFFTAIFNIIFRKRRSS